MADVIKRFDYDSEGDPCLILMRKHGDQSRKYEISIKDLWRFSADHNKNFDAEMYLVCNDIMKFLGIGDLLTLSIKMKNRVMADIAGMIEDAISDVLKMVPPDYTIKKVAEGRITINGETIHVSINDEQVVRLNS